MKMALITLVGVTLLALAILVIRTVYYGAQYAVAGAASGARLVAVSVGGTGPQPNGPYTIHGTAILDYSHGTPPAPYIEYLNTKQATTTKQLVYYGARACNPAAGDFPCVPPYSASDGYPLVSTGQHITATGYIYEDRFLVTSINVND